jgi:acyl carrier protein
MQPTSDSTASVVAAVREYLVEHFLFGDGTRLQEDTPLLESSIMDSTGVLDLIGFLESTFQIRVEDHELIPENLNSLQRIGAYLNQKAVARNC